MGLDDKIENAAEKLGGKGKEAAGKATGDESLTAEGKTDQAIVPEAGRRESQRRFQEGLIPPISTKGAISWERRPSMSILFAGVNRLAVLCARGVLHFADEFFDDVLEEQHAGGVSVGVEDPGHVGAGAAHRGQRILKLTAAER